MTSSGMDYSFNEPPVSCSNLKEHTKFHVPTKFSTFFTSRTILMHFRQNLLDSLKWAENLKIVSLFYHRRTASRDLLKISEFCKMFWIANNACDIVNCYLHLSCSSYQGSRTLMLFAGNYLRRTHLTFENVN